jgi:hypothetical protein
VPEDHTFFDAWEADFSEPDGYGGEEGFNGWLKLILIKQKKFIKKN